MVDVDFMSESAIEQRLRQHSLDQSDSVTWKFKRDGCEYTIQLLGTPRNTDMVIEAIGNFIRAAEHCRDK